MAAIGELVAERGMRAASVAGIARRAGVSPKTFRRHFASPDDCFLALIDRMVEQGSSAMAEAFEREASWSEGVLAALEALVALLDREPLCARACLLEGLVASSAGLGSQVEALGELSSRVHGRARLELSPTHHPSTAMAEGTVGSVLGLLRRRLLQEEAPPFAGLLGELAEVVVTPYLGAEAAVGVVRAGRERARAMEGERTNGATPEVIEVPDLLRRANAHRMRSCVRYLAENPGASNKAVAAGIRMRHQGQVSRLLTRLHAEGLLEKRSGGPGRANVWWLSSHGAEIAPVLGPG